MKSRLLALALALVVGLIATTSVFMYVNRVEERSLEGAKPTTVLVSTRSLPSGTSGNEILETGAFTSKKVPRQYVLPGAMVKPEDLGGLTLADDLAPGEQITEQRFSTSKQGAFLSDFPKGTEALSLPLEYVRGVAGHMGPGDRLNAYLTSGSLVALFKEGPEFGNLFRRSRTPDDVLEGARKIIQKLEVPSGVKVLSLGGEGMTVQVLEDVPVMEVHHPPAGTNGASSTTAGDFTIAVKPEEAAMLVFGQEKAKLWFTLAPQGVAQ